MKRYRRIYGIIVAFICCIGMACGSFYVINNFEFFMSSSFGWRGIFAIPATFASLFAMVASIFSYIQLDDEKIVMRKLIIQKEIIFISDISKIGFLFKKNESMYIEDIQDTIHIEYNGKITNIEIQFMVKRDELREKLFDIIKRLNPKGEVICLNDTYLLITDLENCILPTKKQTKNQKRGMVVRNLKDYKEYHNFLSNDLLDNCKKENNINHKTGER